MQRGRQYGIVRDGEMGIDDRDLRSASPGQTLFSEQQAFIKTAYPAIGRDEVDF